MAPQTTLPLSPPPISSPESAPIFNSFFSYQVYKKEAVLRSLPRTEFVAQCDAFWAKEMAELFGFIDEYGFFGPDPNFAIARMLNPNMTSFEDYLTCTGEWHT